MALKLFPIPFPIFPLPNPNPNPDPSPNPGPYLLPNHRRPTEIRFARWNNANARKFEERRRAQEEIEADIRRHRRFTAATNLSSASPPTSPPASPYFKSFGTPSSPSKPSIPGRKSKYSKPEPTPAHPAFRNPRKITVLPPSKKAHVKLGNDGVSYVIDGAPFEFKYSYTETPKVKPIKLREPPFSPFGPEETPRPWTGRAPLPSSKKKVREFDSFQLPPPNKKGVKSVQSPGPYLPGSRPRYVKTREELLGEPLTPEEVKDLVDGCLKSKRQLNMGRDGLIHNMLDNIHAHWKRRRVCKIKCKGVCTVDMENVCQQLEERTGGKVIYRKGGVLYLFRGRNYNFRTHPRFPLMLWKPVTPVYPRLIQRAPAGLTLEEASDMRKRGRKLIPICKLGKNGVYSNLVRHVREAFGECELVRINCQGMNGSDYRKIGAKLRELVPCVLISFEREHILMWRGREWKSSNMRPVNNYKEAMGSDVDGVHAQSVDDPEIEMLLTEDAANDLESRHTSRMDSGLQEEDLLVGIQEPESVQVGVSTRKEINESENAVDNGGDLASSECEIRYSTQGDGTIKDSIGFVEGVVTASSLESDTGPNVKELATASSLESDTGPNVGSMQDLQEFPRDVNGSDATNKLPGPHVEGVLQLWKQAIEGGSALVLVDGLLDADNVYQSAVAFAQSATPGPVFRHRPRKVMVQKCEIEESGHMEANELAAITGKERNEKKSLKPARTLGVDERYLDEVPKFQGSLRIDELAKLLA